MRVQTKLNILTVGYNEEPNLPKLFESLEYIKSKISVRHIYVDQSSSDNSLKIAKNNGCETYLHKNQGYADPDKKWAVEKLCKDDDRCLIMDSDFEITKQIANEIIKIVKENIYDVAKIYLEDFFLGGYGGKLLQPLLFKKYSLDITNEIHNYLNIKSKKIITLKNTIIHNDLKLLGKEINVLTEKFNRYSDKEIIFIKNISKIQIKLNMIRKPIQRFFGYGIIHKQFLRGGVGIIHCIMMAHYQFLIYAKLYEKNIINKIQKKILNLGCGIGSNIPSIIKRGKITCVDIEQKSLDIAKSKFPQCKYICTTGEDMKFENGFFDEIYCFDVLEHVDNLDKTMKNIHNSLKDDGFVYVEIPYDQSEKILSNINSKYLQQIGHKRIFEYKKLKKTFNEYGFDIIEKSKSRGIAHLYLRILFVLKIDITNQLGETSGGKKITERLIMILTIWFDKNILNTFLKYVPIRLITLPLGAIISEIFPKTIVLKLLKKGKN